MEYIGKQKIRKGKKERKKRKEKKRKSLTIPNATRTPMCIYLYKRYFFPSTPVKTSR
jgi:hypothetical protein